ncbi:MAG TPA: HSP90 family protein [Candidatus Paceibacterota bacterium]|nr:HSP90 family protein [Verrucomicrobiota bacterium]HSA10898.1 HSP90 family protein [Candidatus Paceibacterota bacterium]
MNETRTAETESQAALSLVKNSQQPVSRANQDFRFQVNLQAIIDLLSNHLYSGPQVYIRELLQNAVDATAARSALDPSHKGEILIEVVPGREGVPSTLLIEDNGMGLTQEEIHAFLATIGSSSKRSDFQEQRANYIGQFGIGLLSCFMVTDEIVLITRSARGGPAIEWKGKSDGSYTVRVLETEHAPGTRVFLRSRADRADFLKPPFVRDMAARYGSLLPVPIVLVTGDRRCQVNAALPPWKQRYATESDRRAAFLNYGKRLCGVDFLDFIPLEMRSDGLEGAVFFLPHAQNISARRSNHVFVKGMLLTEGADNLMPPWAVFVRCVINSTQLRPTASREAIYEDDALLAARERLGAAIRDYLLNLSVKNPERLLQIIAIHSQAIMSLAAEDDEFCEVVGRHLPFETSLGIMSLGELQKHFQEINYVTGEEEFRQIAQVAAAQSLCIINARHYLAAKLLERYAALFPGQPVRRVTIQELTASFRDVEPAAQERAARLIETAASTLHPVNCRPSLRRFLPAELPVLYTASEARRLQRSAEQAREASSEVWSGILVSVFQESDPTFAELCLNYENPLIQRLLRTGSDAVARRVVEVLYVQALLLGQYPLNAAEMRLLNQALTGLAEFAAGCRKEGT